MIQQFTRWLGKTRTRLLVGSLVVTGLVSLALVAVVGNERWSIIVQTLLALLFLTIVVTTIGTRMEPSGRLRLFFTVGPSLGLVALSLLLPNLLPILLGMALGWLLAAQFFIRDRMQMEYKVAIKHARRQEYAEAIQAMRSLIKREPYKPDHLRFRGELQRLAGQLDVAIKDYEKAIKLAPNAPEGYSGLAEVYLQQGNLEQAKLYTTKAYKLAPTYWVAPYNLGMIEDRLGNSAAVVEHLSMVVKQGLPDSRHRLLTYLWLARAHHRLGQSTEVTHALEHLRHEGKGLKEWQTIMAAPEATVVKKMLQADVDLAASILKENQAPPEHFFSEGA